MDNQSNTTHLKREVLVRLIKAYLKNDLDKAVDKIPFEMRPKNADVPFRCCIHKERAILRQRAIAGLGHSVENDDEITMLSEYAQKAAERQRPDEDILTVVETACKGCVPSRVYVTDCVRDALQDLAHRFVSSVLFLLRTENPLLMAKNAKTAECVCRFAPTARL